MFWLALFTLLMDGVVSVPKSHWLAIEVNTVKPHTVVDCNIAVESEGSTVDALLMPRAEAERFNRGKSFQPLHSTGFQANSRFRYELADAGDYVLLLDNRLEGRRATQVGVRIELWNSDTASVRTLAPEKRRLVVALSVLFFLAIAGFSARQLLK